MEVKHNLRSLSTTHRAHTAIARRQVVAAAAAAAAAAVHLQQRCQLFGRQAGEPQQVASPGCLCRPLHAQVPFCCCCCWAGEPAISEQGDVKRLLCLRKLPCGGGGGAAAAAAAAVAATRSAGIGGWGKRRDEETARKQAASSLAAYSWAPPVLQTATRSQRRAGWSADRHGMHLELLPPPPPPAAQHAGMRAHAAHRCLPARAFELHALDASRKNAEVCGSQAENRRDR